MDSGILRTHSIAQKTPQMNKMDLDVRTGQSKTNAQMMIVKLIGNVCHNKNSDQYTHKLSQVMSQSAAI